MSDTKKTVSDVDVKSLSEKALVDVAKGEYEEVHEKASQDPNFKYIQEFDVEAYADEEVPYNKVVRKMLKQFFLPFLLAYWLEFLDKVALNYANVMTLSEDLGLVGNEFSHLATYFFVGYIIAEFGQGFIIQKIPVAKVLGANIFIWGVLTACCAATHNFQGILAVRILLGIAELAIVPCMILLTSNHFDKPNGAMFTGIWYSGLGLGQISGGLISFIFQHVSPTAPVSGWKLMFIVIAIFNLAVGAYTYFWIPSTPLANKNLTPKEKYVLLVKLTEGQVGVNTTTFSWKQARELLLDIHPWLLLLISATISFSSNTISTFSATNIRGFGFTSKQAALLNMPSGVVSIFATLLSTYLVKRGIPRFITITGTLIPAVLGGALMSFLPKTNQAGLLVGIYLINFVVAPLGVVYSLGAANLSGSTKKIGGAVFINLGFSIGNIVGPLLYRVEDAPDYIPAKISMLATQAVSIVIVWMIAGLYYVRNKKRDREGEQMVAENAWADMTDFENRTFRYSY